MLLALAIELKETGKIGDASYEDVAQALVTWAEFYLTQT